LTLFEVIVLDALDACNAQAGGADRVELVRDIALGGLTPSVEVFRSVRAATDLPIRVMLRSQDGYLADERVYEDALALREAGAEEFVFGFLASGAVDVPAIEGVLDAIGPCGWTFHRAIDHAADRDAAWAALANLSNVDTVLTSGGPGGHARLIAESGRAPRVMAGGGLREEHLPALKAGGITAFHAGTAVRPSWRDPVDVALVARWRDRLNAFGAAA
jgi:copper homeostasis protein